MLEIKGIIPNVILRPPRPAQQDAALRELRNQFNNLPGSADARTDRAGPQDYGDFVFPDIRNVIEDVLNRPTGGMCR